MFCVLLAVPRTGSAPVFSTDSAHPSPNLSKEPEQNPGLGSARPGARGRRESCSPVPSEGGSGAAPLPAPHRPHLHTWTRASGGPPLGRQANNTTQRAKLLKRRGVNKRHLPQENTELIHLRWKRTSINISCLWIRQYQEIISCAQRNRIYPRNII